MKPALLVIDVQKAFLARDAGTAQSLNAAIRYINAAIELFRAKRLPVVCVQHIQSSDIHIHKTYSNAFSKTDLAAEGRRGHPSSSPASAPSTAF